MKFLFVLTTILISIHLLADSSAPKEESRTSEYKSVVIFALRHAEKASGGVDPELTEAGKERAEALATMLRDAGIEFVHSSPYTRTQNTVLPYSKKSGVGIEEYDPRKLSSLVEKIRKTGGRHLVVGHSNTTPALIKLLTGKGVDPINEKKEFDRLYLVTVDKEGKSNCILIRYGKPFTPMPHK